MIIIRDKREILQGEHRICSNCNINKEITKNYTFYVSNNSFKTLCKICENEKRRITRKVNDKIHNLESVKECIKCNKEYNVLEGFHYNKTNNEFNPTCISCVNEKRRFKHKLKKEGKEVPNYRNIARKYSFRDKAKHVMDTYVQRDKKSDRSNDLTIEFVENILINNCFYCGFPPTGMDRLDNTKGHTQNNCVSCCYECNVARNNNFSHEEMKELGKTIKRIKLKRVSFQ